MILQAHHTFAMLTQYSGHKLKPLLPPTQQQHRQTTQQTTPPNIIDPIFKEQTQARARVHKEPWCTFPRTRLLLHHALRPTLVAPRGDHRRAACRNTRARQQLPLQAPPCSLRPTMPPLHQEWASVASWRGADKAWTRPSMARGHSNGRFERSSSKNGDGRPSGPRRRAARRPQRRHPRPCPLGRNPAPQQLPRKRQRLRSPLIFPPPLPVLPLLLFLLSTRSPYHQPCVDWALTTWVAPLGKEHLAASRRAFMD